LTPAPGIHLAPWLGRWELVPDGEPIETAGGLLLPVRRNGEPAMLKIAREEEERRGGRLMAWWAGDGAARVLARHGPALLLERLDGPRSLAAMVAAARDDEASFLDAGPRGWLAIDPKGLLGERTFDFVNLLRNPDPATATAPGRFARQVGVAAEAGALDSRRLIEWTLAFAGLSAAWHLADGSSAELDFAIGAIAAAALKS
jgi:streptomycin 6-kinase